MKRKTHLVIALVLVAALLLPLYATADEAMKITHWTWSTGAFYGTAWDMFMRDHPEYADIQYEFASQGGSSQDMLQKIMLSYAAGAEVPDVIEMNLKLNPMLIESGVAADITDLVMPYKDKVPEYVWNSAMKDGRMYAIPLRGNSSMMLYREDLCAAAGIDMSALKTWDDFFAAGNQFMEYTRAQGEDLYWTTISPDNPCGYWGEIMFGQQDMGFFDENGECIVDTDPKAIEALKTIYRIYSEGFATKLTDLTPSWYGALAEGKVACILVASWMPTIMMTNNPDGAGLWRVAPYPAFANGKQSMQGFLGFTILATDEKKQEIAARVLLETAFDDVKCYELEEKTVATLSLNIFAEHPPQSENNDKLNAYFGGQNVTQMDMAILSEATIHRYTPAFSEALNILSTEMAKAISDQKTIDEAIADMGKAIRQQIGTSKY